MITRNNFLGHYTVALTTIVVKEITRFTRIWMQTLLPPAITMILYFVIFGNLIGSQIGKVGEFHYVQFIAPGLIMMSIINNAYGNVVSSFFGAKFQRHIEEMLVAPIPNIVLLSGYLLGGIARGLIVGLVVTVIALFFTHLHLHSFWITASVVLLTATIFSLGGLINGIFAKSFDDVSFIPTFILAPLTYLGGVFYSISMLSPFWQKVSLLNPILYMVSAFRYGILGVGEVPIQSALWVLVLLTLTLTVTCIVLLKKGTGLRS